MYLTIVSLYLKKQQEFCSGFYGVYGGNGDGGGGHGGGSSFGSSDGGVFVVVVLVWPFFG